jgi:integrase/recombinase XerD
MTWETSIDLFKRYLKLERNASKNTLISYAFDLMKLKNYVESFESQIEPENITEEIVRNFIYEFSNQDFSERSQARLISSLKHFFTFLILDKYREDNPTERLELPKLSMYLPDTLSEEEINNLISSIDLSHPQGHRNKAILEVLYGTGVRVSELINIKLSEIFHQENLLLITGKGNKQRFVPIADYTLECISYYMDYERKSLNIPTKNKDYLFLNRRGNPLTRNMIFIIIKELGLIIELNKKISPHTFRHSYATHLLQNGADIRSIQLLLGHESIATTEIYTHINNQQLKDTILKYHPRNAKNY